MKKLIHRDFVPCRAAFRTPKRKNTQKDIQKAIQESTYLVHINIDLQQGCFASFLSLLYTVSSFSLTSLTHLLYFVLTHLDILFATSSSFLRHP